MSDLREALRQILGWRELRSGVNEIPIDRIEDIARAALAAEAERVSGWQSIATCPDSCRGEYPKFVLLWNGHHVGVGYCYLSEDGDNTTMYVDETDEIITPKPTHWQPLPKPPTDVLAAAEKEPRNGS